MVDSFCTKCGEKIIPENDFCIKCGAKSNNEKPFQVPIRRKKSRATKIVLSALILIIGYIISVTVAEKFVLNGTIERFLVDEIFAIIVVVIIIIVVIKKIIKRKNNGK